MRRRWSIPRAGRAVAQGALSCCLLACSSGERAFLPSDGLAALVLAAVRDDVVTLEAIDLTATPLVEREPDPDVTTYALGYTASLTALALAPGPLTVDARGERLPTPDQQHVLADATWSSLAALPPALTGLRVVTAGGCATFEQRARSLPVTVESPTLAVPLDGERVLVGYGSGRFEVHEVERSYAVATLPLETPHLAGFAHGDEVWLLGDGRRVVHGHLDRGFVEAPPLPFDLTTRTAVDGSRGDAPFELFVTDDTLGVAHFDGATWRVLRPGSGSGPDGTRPGIAWAGPGRAVLAGTSIDHVVELAVDGSERTVEVPIVPRASPDSIWSVAHVEGRGVVLGSRANVVYQRGEEGWVQLPAATVAPRAEIILGLGRGSFIAGGQGRFAQWRGSDELCETLNVPSGIDTRVSARLGSGFVLVVDGFEARSVIVAVRVD